MDRRMPDCAQGAPMTNEEIDKATGLTRGQLLTFRLGASTYGVDILRVKEIRGWAPVTRIPHSPPHVLGVLNLRGAIVPIIDLRLRFALPEAGFCAMTVIIVLSVMTAAGHRDCGVVVEAVAVVVDILPGAVTAAPALEGGHSHDFRGVRCGGHHPRCGEAGAFAEGRTQP